jgi:hypothetical protein
VQTASPEGGNSKPGPKAQEIHTKQKKKIKQRKEKKKKMVETSPPRGLEPISLPLMGSGYGA